MDSSLTLVEGPPSVDDYLRLRAETGLSPKTEEQGRAGIAGAWAAFHVVDTANRTTVGMGRVIGDGGWYFHIIDMAVLPTYQRRGIGAAILRRLISTIEERAPSGAYVTLMADEAGRALYRAHGFVETGPQTVGMALAPKN